jgi:hypothetical protein
MYAVPMLHQSQYIVTSDEKRNDRTVRIGSIQRTDRFWREDNLKPRRAKPDQTVSFFDVFPPNIAYEQVPKCGVDVFNRSLDTFVWGNKSTETGTVSGTAVYVNSGKYAEEAKYANIVVEKDKLEENIEANAIGDFAVRLPVGKWRLIRVNGADGNQMEIDKAQAGWFQVKPDRNTRFDVMVRKPVVKQVESLNLCTLKEDIQRYQGQRVRLRAFLAVTFENSFLYDPKCRNGEPLSWFELKPKVTGKLKQLRKILEKRRYAFVTIEGIVHGLEPLEVDPKLPDWIKEKYKDSVKRYGHMNAYDIEIVIDNIVDVEDVDDGMGR